MKRLLILTLLTITYKSHYGEHRERDMLFVDVKRNITRTHITY